MGVCCVKQQGRETEIKHSERKKDSIYLLRNNKEAIHKIIKIQSIVRMLLGKRELKRLKEAKELKEGGANNGHLQEISVDTDNTHVKEVEKTLGFFNPGPEPPGLGKRERRQPVTMENGVVYAGEWYF